MPALVASSTWAAWAKWIRHPDLLRYGDALDFWRVVGIERDRSLALRAEMKLPGQALLDFRVAPDGDSKCTLCQTALFEPRGLAGLLYWYAVAPFHSVVFRTMLAGIQRDAIEIAAEPDLDRISTWSMGGERHARVIVLAVRPRD